MLARKLSSYSALASALVSAAHITDAQIVYTEEPDTLSGAGVYQLDLNNDGITDFQLNAVTYAYQTTTFYSHGSWEWNLYAQALDDNKLLSFHPLQNCDIISPFLMQHNMFRIARTFGSSSGGNNWYSDNGSLWFQQNNLMGLQLNLDGHLHLGWLRLDVYEGEVFIRDFAYEQRSDCLILAGEISTNQPVCNSAFDDGIILFEKNDVLQVTLYEYTTESYPVRVLTLLGQEVFSAMLHGQFASVRLPDNLSGAHIAFVEYNGRKATLMMSL